DQAFIRIVFVSVDRVPHPAKIVTKSLFPAMHDGDSGERRRHGSENHEDRAGDDQFEKRHARRGQSHALTSRAIPTGRGSARHKNAASAATSTAHAFLTAPGSWLRRIPEGSSSAASRAR